ncbi:unnamed protein product [marine sediment metagenome]|uniref:Uncharacterized protein n=1 Tax=marine sediment metagenome TaxID=412755 RepID=X0VIN4_9ZZZZ
MNFEELGEKLGEEIEKKVKSKSKSSGKDSPEEVKEMLAAVSSEIPALIKNVFSAIFDPDIAANFGKGIVALHEELSNQGLPESMINEIVMNFSKSFNILGNAIQSNVNIRKDDD